MSQKQEFEHLFRYEYGSLVALLSRRFGVSYLETIEDAVQHAMATALERWGFQGIPDTPSAWLYQVAFRQILSNLKANHRRAELIDIYGEDNLINPTSESPPEVGFKDELNDSLLQMLFVACHQSIPLESQLVFTLKSLCGFSIKEIALRLFISEENVYKRFGRAKKALKKLSLHLDTLSQGEIETRLHAVYHVLYLLFTEGYLSSLDDLSIRQDLCQEAIRLTALLSESKIGSFPESFALLALMHLHFARIQARTDDSGILLLLEHQDRSKWDLDLIKKGLCFLEKSAQGTHLSRYHIEANIAAEHCLAKSFKETRWQNIATAYEILEKISPSPLNQINHAIAVAEWKGPKEALTTLEALKIPSWLQRSYHWYAVLSDLQQRSGHFQSSQENGKLALQLAPTEPIKKMLKQRLKITVRIG